MTKQKTPPPALAAVLKTRAMSLDAGLIRRLRAARHLSERLLHDARVACKSQRAWWQLARPVAGAVAVRNADRRLRDAARAMAPLRESHVMRNVLTRLARQEGATRVKPALEAAGRQLVPAASGAAGTEASETLRGTLLRVFASDAAAWRRLAPAPGADASILAAVGRSYRRARKCSRKAVRRGKAKDLHVWRKWIKIHVAQVAFVQSVRPGLLPGDLAPLVRLGRLLGRGQDLAVLEAWFAWRESTGATSAREARRLHAFLVQRQNAMQERCERLGRRLFAVKPKAFAATLKSAGGAAARRK